MGVHMHDAAWVILAGVGVKVKMWALPECALMGGVGCNAAETMHR